MVSPFLISDEFIYKVLVVSYNLEILVRDDINISFGKVVTFHKKWIPFCGICIFTKLFFVCCSHGVGSIIGETGQCEALIRFLLQRWVPNITTKFLFKDGFMGVVR